MKTVCKACGSAIFRAAMEDASFVFLDCQTRFDGDYYLDKDGLAVIWKGGFPEGVVLYKEHSDTCPKLRRPGRAQSL